LKDNGGKLQTFSSPKTIRSPSTSESSSPSYDSLLVPRQGVLSYDHGGLSGRLTAAVSKKNNSNLFQGHPVHPQHKSQASKDYNSS
jgi:hypothetical protein